MASKTTAPEAAPEAARQLQAIETLRERHKISRPVFAGVCAVRGWKSGKAVEEAAFLQAVAEFTGAPMGASQGK